MCTHCEECEFDCAGSVVVMTVDDVKTVTAQTSQYTNHYQLSNICVFCTVMETVFRKGTYCYI